MVVFNLVERRSWHEWAIGASILALAVVGFLAIWGGTVSELWDRNPGETEESDRRESGPAGTTGTSL